MIKHAKRTQANTTPCTARRRHHRPSSPFIHAPPHTPRSQRTRRTLHVVRCKTQRNCGARTRSNAIRGNCICAGGDERKWGRWYDDDDDDDGTPACNFAHSKPFFSATLKSSTTLLTSSRQWLNAKHTVRTRLIAVHAAHAIRRQTIARTPSAPQASLNNTPGAVWNPPHTHNKSHEIAIDPPVRKSIHYLIIHRVKLRHRVRVPNAKYARIIHTTRDRCDKTHTHTRTHSEQARAGPSSVSIQCRSHSERHMREPLQTHCLTTLTRGTSMPAQPAQVEHRAVHEPFALKQPWASIGAHRSPPRLG